MRRSGQPRIENTITVNVDTNVVQKQLRLVKQHAYTLTSQRKNKNIRGHTTLYILLRISNQVLTRIATYSRRKSRNY